MDPLLTTSLVLTPLQTVAQIFAGKQQLKLASKQAVIAQKQAQAEADAQRRRYEIIGASVVAVGAVTLAAILIYRSSKRK